MEEMNWCVVCFIDCDWLYILERDEPIRPAMMTKSDAEALCAIMALEYESKVVQYVAE